MNELSPNRRGRPVDHSARAARRQQIMDGARTCFRQRGFHAASTAEIAAAAKVSVANLYQYFVSKDELIIAIVEEDLRADLALLSTFTTAIMFATTEAIEVITREASDPAAARLRLEVAAEATRNSTVAEVVRRADRTLRDALASMIEDGKTRGEVRADLDPVTAAFALLCLFDGAFTSVAIGILPPAEAAQKLLSAIRALLAK